MAVSENRKRELEERAAKYMDQVEVGSIFVSSWGYEQTNVDFYQVTRKTEKTITLREIKQLTCETAWCQHEVYPIKDAFEERPILFPAKGKRCKMLGYSDRPMVSLTSYANAYLWDGKVEHATSWA